MSAVHKTAIICLTKVLSRLTDDANWIKGTSAKTIGGHSVGYMNPNACMWDIGSMIDLSLEEIKDPYLQGVVGRKIGMTISDCLRKSYDYYIPGKHETMLLAFNDDSRTDIQKVRSLIRWTIEAIRVEAQKDGDDELKNIIPSEETPTVYTVDELRSQISKQQLLNDLIDDVEEQFLQDTLEMVSGPKVVSIHPEIYKLDRKYLKIDRRLGTRNPQ